MTQTVTFNAQIAAGRNNAAGLTLITNLVDADSTPFQGIQTVPFAQRGFPRVLSTGITRRAGHTSTQWKSSVLWLPQWEYLVATYEGAVTIKTRLYGNTYANYNAYLNCGELASFQAAIVEPYGNAILDFVWTFTRVEAL